MSANIQKIVDHKTDRLARKYVKWAKKRFTKKSAKGHPDVEYALRAAESVIQKHKLERILPKKQQSPTRQPYL